MRSRITFVRASRAIVRVLLSSCVAIAAAAPHAVAADGQSPRAAAIRSISIKSNAATLVVVIEGTGALPMPTSGVAQGPPRIFVDFSGIALAAPKLTPSTDPRLLRVRAGLHSAAPLVTRIVLDLAEDQPFTIERAGNRVSVVVGVIGVVAATPIQAERKIPPVPMLPEPAAAAPAPRSNARPPASQPVAPTANATRATESAPSAAPAPSSAVGAPPRVPSESPAEKPVPKVALPPVPPARSSSPASLPVPPARDLERYRRQVSPTLDRLRLQEPLLMSLDSAEAQPVDRVQLAVEEFERLRQELAGIKPPDTLRSQHDMLIQSTTLALMATRLRVEAYRTADPATLRNVASAAAGATLLLDRACADLGCSDSGR